jgi:PAS domain
MPLAVDDSSWSPALRAFHRYWLSRRPEPDLLPGRQHIDPFDLQEFLPRIWLLDVQRDPFRLRYRLMGTRICELIGKDLTGCWLEEAHPHAVRETDNFARFRRAVETGEPSRRRGKPNLFLASKADFTEIENAAFPLARDGRNTDMLLIYSIFYTTKGVEL